MWMNALVNMAIFTYILKCEWTHWWVYGCVHTYIITKVSECRWTPFGWIHMWSYVKEHSDESLIMLKYYHMWTKPEHVKIKLRYQPFLLLYALYLITDISNEDAIKTCHYKPKENGATLQRALFTTDWHSDNDQKM